MRYKPIITLLFAGVFLLAIGCSENATETTSVTDDPNINEAYGGYTATDEAVGFGDDDLLASAGDDEEFSDVMLGSPGVDSVVSDPEAEYYHMRIVWGQPCYDSTISEITDWSGSLTLSRGAVILRRVVRFELGQDYIPTRTDRTVVDWVSYTTVHNDGIDVDLFVPVDTEAVDPVTVSFVTGPYSREFTLDELVALDTIVYMEDSSAVAFHAFQLNRYPCQRGFLAGHWGFNDDGEGVFRGQWMTHRGAISGYLNGNFGIDDNDMKVFFGKWIDLDGNFEGLISGIWGAHPNSHANINAFRHAGGWFEGHIFDANEVEIGVMAGKFKSAPWFKNGFFQGRWKLHCDARAEEEVDDTEEGL